MQDSVGHLVRVASNSLAVVAALAPFFLGGQAAAVPLYSVTEVGTLPGEQFSFIRGMDAAGDVVGVSVDATGQGRGFLFRGGQLTNLGNIGSSLPAISHNGLVLGNGFIVNTDGSRTYLGQLNGASLSGINDSGQIAGTFDSGSDSKHAFLYNNGERMDIGSLGGGVFGVNAINDFGQIVGFSYNNNNNLHAFLYSNSHMNDLGHDFQSSTSEATAINDKGMVVGGDGSADHPFLYSDGKMKDLAELAGWRGTALGINNAGDIVGYRVIDHLSVFHAALDQAGQLFDINTLIQPDSGWTIVTAGAINDSGQIAAIAMNSDGYSGAVVLNPIDVRPVAVPEPRTLILLLIAGLLLRFRPDRRMA